MTTLLEILHKKAEPYKVKLIKGQKGGYGWEITVNATSIENMVFLLKAADAEMKREFGGGEQHE